jgi:hypothetical protein
MYSLCYLISMICVPVIIEFDQEFVPQLLFYDVNLQILLCAESEFGVLFRSKRICALL